MFDAGADVNAEDEDGDTSLHLVLMRQTAILDAETSPALTEVGLDGYV